MDIKSKFEDILGDDKILAKFVEFILRSSSTVDAIGLAEVFNRNSKLTEVRSYDEWKELGRQVCLGEKGYAYFDDNSKYKSKMSYVFDIKQTKGHSRKPEELDYERFNKVFNDLNEVSEYFLQESITQYKTTIQASLGIKGEKENVEDIESIIKRNGDANRNEIRPNNRANNGNRRSTQERKRTSVGEQLSLFDGIEDTDRSIRITSRRVSQISELGEISQTQSDNDVGERIISIGIESGKLQERESNELSATEELDISASLYGQSDVRFANGRDDIQRDNSPIRYKLSEEDFIHRGPKERCRDNIEAIKIIKNLEQENRQATTTEQSIIAKYVGWGGLQEAFDSQNSSWVKEYAELKTLLSDTEYKTASDSVLNAHFTPKGIIDGIYVGLQQLGLNEGKVLEPSCGTGNFIGSIPSKMQLNFDAVELDGITAKIAQTLYPTDNVKHCGFEDFAVKDETYDAVIGNVPFGDYRVYDSAYNRHKFVIHDYFIAKSIDKLRAGGVMAVITGKGSMDKLNSSARKYYAERAELLGAFRLPNTAFKSNAGTETVADILFFKKREKQVPISELNEEWVTSSMQDGIALNNYFKSHPENVLGEFKIVSGRFGNERTVEPTSDNLSEQIINAVKKLPHNAYEEISSNRKKQEENVTVEEYTEQQLDALGIRNFSLCILKNKVYLRDGANLIEPLKNALKKELSGRTLERAKSYILLRDQTRKIIDLQCDNCSDEVLQNAQKDFNSVYDDFVKSFGCISSPTNQRLFEEDIDYPLASSIEDYDKESDTAKKRDIFSKRTIKQPEYKNHTDDIYEALAICKNELGEIDLHYIEKLTGLSHESITDKLAAELFQLPQAVFDENINDKKYSGWVTREEYLSGNVVEKLEIAQYHQARLNLFKSYTEEEKTRLNAFLDKNINALQSVQPKKLVATEIKVRLGATWIEDEDYSDFLASLLKREDASYSFNVLYNTFGGQYSVKAPVWAKNTAEARNIWGTERMNAVDIFDCALNNRPPTVWDKIQDGDKEKRVVNKAETAVVREKVKEMNAEFSKWIWQNRLREKYEKIYNRRFNATVLPEYNGEYLQFDGMNACINLRDHQKDVVARMTSGNNVLLHHCVGAGKTYSMIAGAMKLRQYGIANKPMFVVPNPLVSQWSKDIKLLYPNAKVLVTSKEEFEKQNRRRFISKIATGDWDMVLISESQFRRIPVSKERQLAKTEEVIEHIRQSIEDYQERHRYDGGRSLTIKTLKATLKKKETKYKELQDKVKRIQDDIIPFEKLGVDYLFVDEAHTYKNKEIETSMTNVAGITSGGSDRAFDLEMKIDYLNELRGGDKGVIFATGTPISNSMAEMYTMQTYLAKSDLAKAGLTYFDAWASTFGEVVTSWELNTSGNGVKPRTRFARFVNLPELQKMYRKFADVKTAEMLKLPVPKVERQTITIPATEQILAYNDEIIARGERIEGGGVDPTEDNMLKLTSDGKKLALDPRCLDSEAEDEEDTKVNVCIKKVVDIYEQTQADKLAQVIFCDASTPKSQSWSVYQDIKDKLMALGIPEKEIAFIHDADTDVKKEKLFSEVNAGAVRVLLGSTQKCGVGANIQKCLKALHHLDVPYRPSDMEQREGRIIRQGNENKNVEIYSYITEKTFDSYSYQILETKQRFISQINKGDMSLREASDIDEATLSFAQIKAIATANPDFLRQMELINTVKELRMLKAKHYENQKIMSHKLTRTLPEDFAIVGNRLSDITRDINDYYIDNPTIKIDGISYQERAKAGEALMIVYQSAKDGQVIGELGNFKIIANKSLINGIPKESFSLQGCTKYIVEKGESGLGNLTRIENVYKEMPSMKDKLEFQKLSIEKQMDELRTQIDKPWSRADELESVEKELADIEERLQVNKEEVVEETISDTKDNATSKSQDCNNEIQSEDEENDG